MRRAPRQDANHQSVVKAFRQCGFRVQDLSGVGKGCADILVAKGKAMSFVEIKDGTKPPSAQKLTSDQLTWHAIWGDNVRIVRSLEDVMEMARGWA